MDRKDVEELKAENARLRALVAALQSPPLWSSCLTLGQDREPTSGSATKLADAVACGADIRVVTHFRHNEHVDASSSNDELVLEPSSFPVTIALFSADSTEGTGDSTARTPSWTAAVMLARQPVNPNDASGAGGFNGSGASLSLFMYNQNGQQARAVVQMNKEAYVAATTRSAEPPSGEFAPGDKYPKQLLDGMMEIQSEHDFGTLAPSSNFIYKFQSYEFFAATRWEMALQTSASGAVLGGSFEALASASAAGSRVKLGVRRFAAELAGDSSCCDHEFFVECGWCFYYPKSAKFSAATQLCVRVAPDDCSGPVVYRSGRWDLGWLFAETSGHCCFRRLDPYTLAWEDRVCSYELRWFVQH